MRINGKLWTIILISLFLLTLMASPAFADVSAEASGGHAWWFWPLILLIVTFIMGILAVLGGVGGGVLFVPIISGFFPFHLDFVRGTGLLVALSGALAAGPRPPENEPCQLKAGDSGGPHRLNLRHHRSHDRTCVAHQYRSDFPWRHHPRYMHSNVNRQKIDVSGCSPSRPLIIST